MYILYCNGINNIYSLLLIILLILRFVKKVDGKGTIGSYCLSLFLFLCNMK